MKAIILAAGVGKRLNQNRALPKCLLGFNGRSLLERHLSALAAVKVDNVTLCVGYEASQIAAAITAIANPKTLMLHNPQYRQGSVLSLWTARNTLKSGDSVLIMDADVLYHPNILVRLVESPQANCLLLDRDFEGGDEPVKICLDAGRIVEFRKHIPAGLKYNLVGESVGFFKFDAMTALRLATYADAYAASGRGNEPHEEALRDLVLDRPEEIGVADITGQPWVEIDFPEDVQRAKEVILPELNGN